MRGKVFASPLDNHFTRITPAHAGKSYTFLGSSGGGGDHPRPCGEKYRHTVRPLSSRGSPPPMRGKALGLYDCRARERITPAHAGKRLPRTIYGGRIKDHPRPCGEKNRPCMSCDILIGSPPPMRGKVNAISSPGRKPGITPAHAGKRAAIARSATAARDHPRPCGEKKRRAKSGVAYTGSPPPMRGKV